MSKKNEKIKLIGKKPTCLFENKLFKNLKQNKVHKHRDWLYRILDQSLGYRKQSHITYRDWFSNPAKLPKMEDSFYELLADCLIVAYKRQLDIDLAEFKQINKIHEDETRARKSEPEM